MLDTTFRSWDWPEPAVGTAAAPVVLQAGRYSLPEEVAAVTAAVFGLHDRPLPPSLTRSVGPAAGAAGAAAAVAAAGMAHPVAKAKVAVTPAVLDALYNVSAAGVNVSRGNSSHPRRAVVGFSGEYMSQKDLTKFFASDVPSAQPGDDKVQWHFYFW